MSRPTRSRRCSTATTTSSPPPGQAFLATTFNCARCHDHKADPIPQTDYYQMVAFVRDIRPYSNTRDVRSAFNLTDITPPEQRAEFEAAIKARDAKLGEVRKAMEAVENAFILTLPAEDQRAAEGPGRDRVVMRKVIPALTGKAKADYAALRKQRSDLERKTDPPNRQLALSP